MVVWWTNYVSQTDRTRIELEERVETLEHLREALQQAVGTVRVGDRVRSRGRVGVVVGFNVRVRVRVRVEVGVGDR